MNCIVNWFTSTSELMRFTALKALGQWDMLPSYSNKFMLRMIIATNDANDDIKGEALRLQTMWDLSFDSDELGEELVVALTDNGGAHLQKSCSAALGVWLKNKPDSSSTILQLLMKCYEDRNKVQICEDKHRPLAHNVNLRDLPFYVKSVVMLRKTENRSFNHLR